MFQSTVPELLEQWYHTVGDVLSIEERDRKYRNAWRKDVRTRQNYYRRHKIIRWINLLAKEKNFSRNQATNIFGYVRREEGITLYQLSTHSELERIVREASKSADDPYITRKLTEAGLNFNIDPAYVESDVNANNHIT